MINIKKFIKPAFVLFLLSVPFSYTYSLAYFEENRSYTFFPLFNVYLVDITAVFFIAVVLINLYLHRKSFFASFPCRDVNLCVSTGLLLFSSSAFLSLLWSGSPFLSAFWGFRLLALALALHIYLILIRGADFYKNLFFKIFIAAGAIESLIALGQFLFQKSLGLYLLGESHLGADMLGLARVDFLGHSLLRAYGTFPHPNVLGGFLLFTIAATFCHFLVRTIYELPLRKRNLVLILTIIQLTGLGLTFSRSAMLGFLIVVTLSYASCRDVKFCVSTRKNKRMFGLSLVFLTFFSLFLIRSPIQRILNGSDPTTRLRVEYAAAAYHRFLASPILGRGWGTGPIELPAFSNFSFYPWEMQPVHNIYLLVLSDLGAIGLIVFLYFVYRALLCRGRFTCPSDRRETRPYTGNIWKNLFIAYLFIGLFDHYLFTLPQGIFIFLASALLFCLADLSAEAEAKEKIPPKEAATGVYRPWQKREKKLKAA